MLLLGVSFTSLGTAKLLAASPPDGNFKDTKFHFGFLKGNPYDHKGFPSRTQNEI